MSRKFFLSLAAFSWGLILSILAPPVELALSFATTAFSYFRPDATTSLRLNRHFAATQFVPVQRSRFRSFLERAKTHRAFAADHFDPGRMLA